MFYRAVVVALACFAFPVLGSAQNARLKLPSFTHLQNKATDSVDITIGATPLRMAGWFMSGDDPDSVAAKNVIKGLQAIYVRNYQFDSDFVYSKADLDAVRAQLSAPGWSQLVKVHDRKQNEDIDVYIAYDHEKVAGLAIIASEPRQFTILNIVGVIDLEDVGKIQTSFRLPDTGAERIAKRTPLL